MSPGTFEGKEYIILVLWLMTVFTPFFGGSRQKFFADRGVTPEFDVVGVELHVVDLVAVRERGNRGGPWLPFAGPFNSSHPCVLKKSGNSLWGTHAFL